MRHAPAGHREAGPDHGLRGAHDPFGEIDEPGDAKVRFSRVELGHLTGAVLLLCVAFALMLTNVVQVVFVERRPLSDAWPAPAELIGGFAAIVGGFVLHELAHKLVAQLYGHWAEFRASFPGLGVSILFAMGGFFLAAPGAVMIYGHPSRRENGVISLAGPLVNGVLAVAAWPFALGTGPVSSAMHWVAVLNAFLMLLNMLPFSLPGGNTLDGRKVLWWSKGVYVPTLLGAVALLVGVLWTVGLPIA